MKSLRKMKQPEQHWLLSSAEYILPTMIAICGKRTANVLYRWPSFVTCRQCLRILKEMKNE